MLCVYLSDIFDPYVHLAFEEYLLRHEAFDEWALFLYRNDPCIVVGRNQNPWTECRVAEAGRRGVPVLRRVSGGGTVYHDRGNLNVTLVGPRRVYDPTRHVRLMGAVLERLGLRPEIDSRQSVFVEGRKVSGSAYMLTGARALQHATLLLDADLHALRTLLQADAGAFETHASRSVPQPVTNLRDHAGHADARAVGNLLVEEASRFGPVAGVQRLPAVLPDSPQWERLLERYRSWDWIFGRTPPFLWRCTLESPRGCAEATLRVRRGLVEEASVHAPDWPEPVRRRVLESLHGVRFDPALPATWDGRM